MPTLRGPSQETLIPRTTMTMVLKISRSARPWERKALACFSGLSARMTSGFKHTLGTRSAGLVHCGTRRLSAPTKHASTRNAPSVSMVGLLLRLTWMVCYKEPPYHLVQSRLSSSTLLSGALRTLQRACHSPLMSPTLQAKAPLQTAAAGKRQPLRSAKRTKATRSSRNETRKRPKRTVEV